MKKSAKPVAALTALKALQEDARRKGLDKLTMDEINAEIATHRREKRASLAQFLFESPLRGSGLKLERRKTTLGPSTLSSLGGQDGCVSGPKCPTLKV